jgi:hypothetical protein
MDFKERKAVLDSHDGKLMAIISMSAAIGSLIFIFVKSFLLTLPFVIVFALGFYAYFPRHIDEDNIGKADKLKTMMLKLTIVLFVLIFIAVAWLVARDFKFY